MVNQSRSMRQATLSLIFPALGVSLIHFYPPIHNVISLPPTKRHPESPRLTINIDFECQALNAARSLLILHHGTRYAVFLKYLLYFLNAPAGRHFSCVVS
jgi:hypothetical protein